MKFEVQMYEKDNGECPVEEFMLSVDDRMRAKLSGLVKVLAEKGNELREPYSKYLEDGIFELRGKVGSDISRVLYFFYYKGKIILTNGFVKKTKKTPRKQIKLAKARRKAYIERMEKNETI